MGRTIWYELYTPKPLPPRVRREINLAQAMMNHHFHWTHERLALRFRQDEPDKFEPNAGRSFDDIDLEHVAEGCTMVGKDEWNALFVVMFLRWVSSRLPDAVITIHDEGDLVLPQWVYFRAVETYVDIDRIAEELAQLLNDGHRARAFRLDLFVQAALNKGMFYAPIEVGKFKERPELAEILETSELTRDTWTVTGDVPLNFPWKTDWLDAR